MCKVFAFTLLNSVKQSRSVLRQQRAALCSSSDKVVASASGDQPQSAADVSQSDFSRLLNQYREAEAQVCIGNMANISWIIYGTLTLFGAAGRACACRRLGWIIIIIIIIRWHARRA